MVLINVTIPIKLVKVPVKIPTILAICWPELADFTSLGTIISDHLSILGYILMKTKLFTLLTEPFE